VHSVHNPTSDFAGAFHVYGGEFLLTPRSEWDDETLDERPFDVQRVLRLFDEQNARFAER
jgi:predicted metal-dependent enzyme (double-stranded beta helix superfamily)